MTAPADRQKVWFTSGDAQCAAWHYPGASGACVIMTGGYAVTKEPGTDRFARRFHEAGFSVLAFDYRRLGESGGQPRQVIRLRDQLADWQAAIGCARTLPEVDPARIAIWSFSLPGGHIFPRRGPQPGPGRRDRPDAQRRRPGRHPQRGPPPAPVRDAALHRPGRAGRRRRPGRAPAAAGAADRAAGHRRPAHHPGRPGHRPGPHPGEVPGLAARGRRPVRAPGGLLPPRPLRRPGHLPAAGRGGRPGPVGAGRARRPRRAPGPARRAGPGARRALRAVPGRPRAGRRGRARLPGPAPGRARSRRTTRPHRPEARP